MQFGVIIRNKWVYMYMLDVATDGKTEALSYRICVKLSQLVSNGLQSPHSSSRHHFPPVNSMLVVDIVSLCLNSTHSSFF